MINTPQIPLTHQPADFLAKVYLLSPEEGGRSLPVSIGYRPQIYFNINVEKITCTSGSWQKMGTDKLLPGQSTEIEIAILAKEYYKNSLAVGMKFPLKEGSVKIAEGVILEIYNKELEVL